MKWIIRDEKIFKQFEYFQFGKIAYHYQYFMLFFYLLGKVPLFRSGAQC